MDALRECVENQIRELIDEEEWGRCALVNMAEKKNLKGFLQEWNKREQFEAFRREWTEAVS
jgi:hypothetical protein